jgi:predicted SAM-dependent methyltransferase
LDKESFMASQREIDPRYAWLSRRANGWQFGEQGVIDAITERLFDKPGVCVEFGIGDTASSALMVSRLVKRGWKPVFIESDERLAQETVNAFGDSAVVLKAAVGHTEKDNLDVILEAGAVSDIGVLVIDVDSIDWHIWNACEKTRPAVVCIEHHDLGDLCRVRDIPDVPSPEVAGFLQPNGINRQANWEAVHDLGLKKGYVPMWRGRINTVFVRGDLAEKLADEPEIRLNIGAGKKNIEGYIPIDIKDGIDARKLPYPDESVAEVYASHVLEHFGFKEVPEVLAEWARVLKPGGLMRISVPDREKVEERRTDANSSLMDRILMGGQTDEHDYHKSIYTEATLRRAMNKAGIAHVHSFDPINLDCSNINISANLEGRKRHWPKVEITPQTAMLVLSEPRLGFNSFNSNLRSVLRTLPLSEARVASAFWEQAMQRGVNDVLEAGSRFVVFVDYDSVFTADDFWTLMNTINSDPTCAAIGCVQASRHNDRPLVFDDTADYSTEVTRVRFSHFGLTIVRREVFEELPKPWWWGIPDEKGEWGTPGACDADITFWRALQEHGLKVLQHNKVVIGHVQESVIYPGEKGMIYVPPRGMRNGHPKQATFNPDAFRPKAKPVEVPT